MTPGIILLWVQMITEAGATLEKLFALGKRINAGEEVTEEQLLAAKQATDQAVNEWDDAAVHDRENKTDG